MPVTDELRTVILKNGTTSEIREMAQTQGHEDAASVRPA